MDKKYDILFGISLTLSGLAFFSFMVFVFAKSADFWTRLIVFPFLIASLAIPIYGIYELIKSIMENISKRKQSSNIMDTVEKIESSEDMIDKITKYIYLIGFLLFWFGFLIIFDFYAIKSWNDNGWLMFLFSFIFWAVGIIMLIGNIKK